MPGAGQVAISREYARQLRQEAETGHTRKGVPLDDEQRLARVAKLRNRALTMSARFRSAELARINEIENRFVGHLAAAVEHVNAHTSAEIEPIRARLEGRVPARREGQTASERKVELDLAMVGLRHERKELVAEEKEAKRRELEAKRQERAAQPPSKRRRGA